ncbi:YjhX family toxin [Parvibaculaceae bacterium PLY_AMNH_Bact1]|nr:YjhX family toxin [Parvibaculaceae bacterium PLY_AMNH_Bact1]
MDISRPEQKVLHVMAQGGRIVLERDDQGKVVEAICVTRDGWYLTGFTLELFKKLKRRRYIASRKSGPYRITERGIKSVRGQADNR